MDISVLEDLGFSAAEIKIYLALLELGNSKAGEIIKLSKLQNSVVHLTLSKMVEKGLVSFLKRGQIRFYEACDPRNIIRLIEDKKNRFEAILPQLLARQNKQEKQEAEVFEGFNGLKAMLYKAIEEGEEGDEYLFFSFTTANKAYNDEVYPFYNQFLEERERRGFIMKGIASESNRRLFTKSRRNLEGLLFVKFPTLQNISIFRNKVIMTPWEDRQMSFLITSSQLADTFRNYFYSIWNKYKGA